MLINIWLSLMLVALLSKRDRNRVAGRTLKFGGVCLTCKTVIAKEAISYSDVGITPSNNFIKHSQDVIIFVQSCGIGCRSYEDEMILNGWLR